MCTKADTVASGQPWVEANKDGRKAICPCPSCAPQEPFRFYFFLLAPLKRAKQIEKRKGPREHNLLKRPIVNKVVGIRMELITSSGHADSERVSTIHGLVSELLTKRLQVRLYSSLRPGEGGLAGRHILLIPRFKLTTGV